MVTLSEMQTRLRNALLEPGEHALEDIFGPTAKRFEIHQKHFIRSITSALEETFPAVVSLVDRRFFAFAADSYIRSRPPVSPCLSEYGADLPDFLAAFPACAGLPYLADVARLEWEIHAAYHAQDRQADAGSIFRPSARHFTSPFPVHRIWNVALGRAAGPVDVAAGPAYLLIYRVNDDVTIEQLNEPEFRVHRALAESGGDIALVAHAASELYPGFNIDVAINRLRKRADVLAHPLATREQAA